MMVETKGRKVLDEDEGDNQLLIQTGEAAAVKAIAKKAKERKEDNND